MAGLLGHFRDEDDEDDRGKGSGMFGIKMGTWTVHSDKDKRWNNSGRAYGLVCGGGPLEMQDWVEKCKKKYGKPPDDCTMEFWKD
jgi:hypothetical protein